MNFGILDVSGKGLYLAEALTRAGHTSVRDLRDADVFLLDCDWSWAGRTELIATAHQAGAKIALYPHGGQPLTWIYDGLTDPDPRVDLRLEHGPGARELAQHFEVPNQECVGWLFSPTDEFQPARKPTRVLFAPQHPNMEMLQTGVKNGGDPGPALNQPVYKQLLRMGYELTVTVVGPAWRSGVFAHPRARIVQNDEMYFPASFALIQEADVVVAAGTLAAAAVACGKPTVMIGQFDLTDYVDGRYQEAAHADEYRDLVRFPYNVEGGDLDHLIREASTNPPTEWRDRFVGDDGTQEAVRLLEELVASDAPSVANVTIQGVTARAKGLGG